ncbi:hypothetical protein BGZ99_002518 [Dissophora globulifera]|uniref:Uncharacterized protein n=1 Tax=Dissophora globulifera TaxID=979702 RepID=A0A9P6UXA4_9FUNG|nr:hypothetical protein BGZ99_002518 [Dissophora globulifera]
MDVEYQYVQARGVLVRLKVTYNPSTGLKYLFWGDLRAAFPGIIRIQDGDIVLPFMRCQREYRTLGSSAEEESQDDINSSFSETLSVQQDESQHIKPDGLQFFQVNSMLDVDIGAPQEVASNSVRSPAFSPVSTKSTSPSQSKASLTTTAATALAFNKSLLDYPVRLTESVLDTMLTTTAASITNKHAFKMSDFEDLLPSAKRADGMEIFLSSSETLTMLNPDGDNRRASSGIGKNKVTVQASEATGDMQTRERPHQEQIKSGHQPLIQEQELTIAQRHPSSQKSKQKSKKRSTSTSNTVSQPTSSDKTVIATGISMSPASSPSLKQSDGASQHSSNGNDIIDIIDGIDSSKVLSLLSHIKAPAQSQAVGKRAAARRKLPISQSKATSTVVSTLNPDKEEFWTELRQMLRVFNKAVVKGNLWVADRMGLQIERWFFDLERRAVNQPELRDKFEPLMDVFFSSQEIITPKRVSRIQSRARALLEQQQRVTESQQPILFVILPDKPELPEKEDQKQGQNQDSQPRNKFRAHFLCQCQGQELCRGVKGEVEGEGGIPSHFGHFTTHPGYELALDHQFVMMYGMFMFEILDMIKYGVVLEDVHIAPDDDDDDDEQHGCLDRETEGEGTEKKHVGDCNSSSKKTITIPPLSRRGSISEVDLYQRVNVALEFILNSRFADTPANCYRTFIGRLSKELKRPYPDGPLGGLYRVLSSEGSARWICADHYNSLTRTPRMNAFIRLIESEEGVPMIWEPHLGQIQVLLPNRAELTVLLNILRTLRAPVQDLTLMLDWEVSCLDLEQLSTDIIALSAHLPSIRICLGKSVISSEVETFALLQNALIRSMLLSPRVHFFLIQDAVSLPEGCDAMTRLVSNWRNFHFENWERYSNTRAVIVKNARGDTNLGLLVESSAAGLQLVDTFYSVPKAQKKMLSALQLYTSEDDAARIHYEDGAIAVMTINATASSPKVLLMSPNIDELQFRIRTVADRPIFEAILKRNPDLCEVTVHCPLDMMLDIFMFLKRWRNSHGELPSVQVECDHTKIWWIQELFSNETPVIELSVQEPTELGPILESVAPELGAFDGPLLDSQMVMLSSMTLRGKTKLRDLELDISYLTAVGLEAAQKLIVKGHVEVGITVSSRPSTIETASLNWSRIASFLKKVSPRNLQLVGPDLNVILHNLQLKQDLMRPFTLAKLDLFGGKGVSLDATKGLPLVLALVSKSNPWDFTVVDLDIDAVSWRQIIDAINFRELGCLEVWRSGFGPEQLGYLMQKMSNKSALQKLRLHMAVRPTSKEAEQWRQMMGKKAEGLNFSCEMDERDPDEIGVRMKEAKY